MKVERIAFGSDGSITEIENLELEPGELEAFERLVHAMTELEQTRRIKLPPARTTAKMEE